MAIALSILNGFSHMTRDVAVFVKSDNILDFFWKLPQIWTSNFRKVVRQYTEGMVGSIICVLLEIYFFLAVKEFWKSVKNWQNYCHEFGVLLFLGHRVEAGDGNKRIKLRNWRDTRVYIQDDKKHW